MKKDYTFTISTPDDTLEQLQKMTSRDNKGEVIRDALEFYLFLARKVTKNNQKIFIGQNRESSTEVSVSTFKK